MQRQRIAQTNHDELAEILIESYKRLGITLRRGDEKLALLMDQLYKYHGQFWADSITPMFELYANGKIQMQGLKADASSWFFKELKTAFFNLGEIKKRKEQEEAEQAFKQNRAKVAYTRFMRYCETYRKFPHQEEWLLILQFLRKEKGWKMYDGFDKEPEEMRLKTARYEIKKFAHAFFARKAQQSLAA